MVAALRLSAIIVAAAVLAGCAQEFPRLCDVPERPRTSTAAERQRTLERLEADRDAQQDARDAILR